jgi:hypothetical protein
MDIEMLKETSFLDAGDTYGERKNKGPGAYICSIWKPLSETIEQNFSIQFCILGKLVCYRSRIKTQQKFSRKQNKEFPTKQMQIQTTPDDSATSKKCRCVCLLALKNKWS